MKIHFSLPTDEAFFNRYATLTPTLSKLGIIAQFVYRQLKVGQLKRSIKLQFFLLT